MTLVFRSAALLLVLLRVQAATSTATPHDDVLNVLLVTAHPDDETIVAGTLYKLAHSLGAGIDLAIVTDGSGGYAYSVLGERYYGVPLTEEHQARQHLPLVRKREVIEAGRILGIRNIFFFDELDHEYTVDVDTVLQHVWDVDHVRSRFTTILRRVQYDYVLTLLPTAGTHGHHKGATILLLEAVAALPLDERPVVLGVDLLDATQLEAPERPPYDFTGLTGHDVTAVDPDAPVFRFDRRQPLEPDGLLDYRLVANWALAEHKSQGSLAGYFGWGDYEFFWFFALNDPDRMPATAALFALLDENPWREGRQFWRD